MKKNMNNKDIIAEIEKRFGRHTNILMEQMRHEVKTVAEGHSILAKKLDKVGSEIGDVKMELQAVKADVHTAKSDVHAMKSELHSVNMAVMDTAKQADKIEKKLDENLEIHEKRISKLEEKVLA